MDLICDDQHLRSSFFSVDDRVEGKDDEFIPRIDLRSTIPFIEGSCLVKIDDFELKMCSPTIKEIATIFHYVNDGHHVYLERIDIDIEKSEILLISGS